MPQPQISSSSVHICTPDINTTVVVSVPLRWTPVSLPNWVHPFPRPQHRDYPMHSCSTGFSSPDPFGYGLPCGEQREQEYLNRVHHQRLHYTCMHSFGCLRLPQSSLILTSVNGAEWIICCCTIPRAGCQCCIHWSWSCCISPNQCINIHLYMKVFPQWCQSLKSETGNFYLICADINARLQEMWKLKKNMRAPKNTIIFQKINHKELEINELPNKEFT